MTDNNTLFYHAVKVQIQSGKIEGALSDLEVFLEENTTDEVALSLYGSALLRSGDFEKAISTFRRAVSIYPSNPGTHTNLAFAAMQAGESEQAIESYENALSIRRIKAIFPENKDFMSNLITPFSSCFSKNTTNIYCV